MTKEEFKQFKGGTVCTWLEESLRKLYDTHNVLLIVPPNMREKEVSCDFLRGMMFGIQDALDLIEQGEEDAE